MKKKAKGARPYLGRILVLAIYLALWTLAYRLVGQDILLASPLQVVRVLGQLVVKGEFWQSVANSLLRILLGFVLAVLAGSFLAVLTSLVPAARLLLSPALNTLKATPITSFIILALIWLRGERVAVFIAFLAVLPLFGPMWPRALPRPTSIFWKWAASFAFPPFGSGVIFTYLRYCPTFWPPV